MIFISLSCHRPNKIVTNCRWLSYLCTFPDLLTRYLLLKMTWIHFIPIQCFPFKLSVYRSMIWMEKSKNICLQLKHEALESECPVFLLLTGTCQCPHVDLTHTWTWHTWDYHAFINSVEWKWLLSMFVLLKGIIAVSSHKNICQRQLEHFEHPCPRLVL